MKRSLALPSELIFFVTSHCHLQCRHCFNWKNLQRSEDLSLDEIEAFARALPTLKNLMISGGEPFLRKDLVDICRLFARHGRIRMIDIPTSGTLVEKTVSTVAQILRLEPSFYLSIGISLDGMEEYHDRNRGVSGTFRKAVECCDRLLELKKQSKRLKVNVLSTLTGDNKDELLALKKYVAGRLPAIDNFYWGVARGETRDETAPSVSADDLVSIDREFLDYDIQKKGRSDAVARRFYELRRKVFGDRRQPVPCVAASRIAVVYDEGSVAPCELLPPVGNLRDLPFDRIWSGSKMQQARDGIASGSCACTHECFLYPSLEAFLLERPLTLFRLAGCAGLVHWAAAKFGLEAVAWKLRRMLERFS